MLKQNINNLIINTRNTLKLNNLQNNHTDEAPKRKCKYILSSPHTSNITSSFDDIEILYNKLENIRTFNEYGPFHFNISQTLSQIHSIPKTFLHKHKLHPSSRTQMVDWMSEVFNAYHSSDETFFLCVDIMDQYITLTNSTLQNEDIYLLGIICIFIASKTEDLYPMRMEHILQISNYNFTEEEIKIKEMQVIKKINFNIITASIYYFVLCYFSDLVLDNEDEINKNDVDNEIEEIKNVCIYYAKIVKMSEMFYEFNNSLIAISCLVYSFDIYRSIKTKLDKEKENFLSEWITCIVNASGFNCEEIKVIYNRIELVYNSIENMAKNKHGKYFILTLNPFHNNKV